LAEVLSPALEGQVVTMGQHLLEDGAAIVIAGAKTDASAARAPGPGVQPGPAGGPREGGAPR
jgi:hypothetical protein